MAGASRLALSRTGMDGPLRIARQASEPEPVEPTATDPVEPTTTEPEPEAAAAERSTRKRRPAAATQGAPAGARQTALLLHPDLAARLRELERATARGVHKSNVVAAVLHDHMPKTVKDLAGLIVEYKRWEMSRQEELNEFNLRLPVEQRQALDGLVSELKLRLPRASRSLALSAVLHAHLYEDGAVADERVAAWRLEAFSAAL